MISDNDLFYLNRAVELAKIALDKGDEPFGSVLVSADGNILYEGHNQVSGGDHTRHPEFEIAKWAANNLTESERANSTVYTSGEHCPMCAAAHGWVGLGRIVYAASSQQLVAWLKEFGAKPSRVRPLPIQEVINDTELIGPVHKFSEKLKEYHKKNIMRKKKLL